ncbi:unnamed protein product, partial [Strongylus vulgaris]
MRATFLILAFFIVVSFAYDPIFVNDLKALVSDDDQKALDIIDKDQEMNRSKKKEKVDEILARQSEEVKKSYEEAVQHKKNRRQTTMKWRLIAAKDLLG